MYLVLLVIAAFLALCAAAAARLFARIRRRDAVRSPALLWTDRALFTAGGIGLLAFGYGYWIEPRRVEVTTIPIATPKLPPGAPPIRIVHLSDFHSPSNNALQDRLPLLVREQKPDLIVFTGDAVNTRDGVGRVRRTMSELARIAPTFAVRGNRDLGEFANDDLFGTGATELRGSAVAHRVRGTSLALTGASFTRDWTRVRRTLRAQPDSAFVIYLAHSPDGIDDVSRWGADLYLAGHTHGGQVALPFYGAVWTASRHGKRFERGLHRERDTWLYINRGIGMEAVLPKIRFLARPEITVVELRPALHRTD
jgi:predicted MPP superfamily phosphohydrolase